MRNSNPDLRASQHRLDWLRQNVEQYIAEVDGVLAQIVPPTLGIRDFGDQEPWVDRLFEKRHGLQMMLADIKRQIGQRHC